MDRFHMFELKQMNRVPYCILDCTENWRHFKMLYCFPVIADSDLLLTKPIQCVTLHFFVHIQDYPWICCHSYDKLDDVFGTYFLHILSAQHVAVPTCPPFTSRHVWKHVNMAKAAAHTHTHTHMLKNSLDDSSDLFFLLQYWCNGALSRTRLPSPYAKARAKNRKGYGQVI
jgi:hypothetical protein